MQVLCLSEYDRHLMLLRFGRHENSQRALQRALAAAGGELAVGRSAALRQIERVHNVDLAEICHRFARRNDPGTHPIERFVISYIAEERPRADGAPQLWVRVDRIHEVRELMEGRAVGEPS